MPNIEMQRISESVIQAIDTIPEREVFVVAENETYVDIPHLNGLVTPAIALDLRARKLSKLTITHPRKDSSTAISIVAYDEQDTKRSYRFTELTDELKGNFIIDDSDWSTAQKSGRPVATVIETNEVAHWLYRQSGLSEQDSFERIKRETDPVSNAAVLLSSRANSIMSQMQYRVDISPNLQFFAEKLSAKKPDNVTLDTRSRAVKRGNIPIGYPIRSYTAWINQIHETETYGNVCETIFCQFSPDNPILLLPNPQSDIQLELRSDKELSRQTFAQLFVEREEKYKTSLPELFDRITQHLVALHQKETLH